MAAAGWVCFGATWALAVLLGPPAIGHAFNLGREEGWREGHRQGRKEDERNGVPVAVFVPLPPRKERRHG